MISIKSKKKEILSPTKEATPSIPVEKNNEIIDGGLQLIEIIYNYITGDSVGMTQLDNSTAVFNKQNDILDQQIELLSHLDDVSASIMDIITSLSALIADERNAVSEMCDTLIDINTITDSMLTACQGHSLNQVTNLNAIYSMKQSLSQMKQQVDSENATLLETIANMEGELKKLEANVSISYAKNDRYLHNIEKLCNKCNYYKNRSLTYDEKTEKIIFRVNQIIKHLDEVNETIIQVKTLDSSIAQMKSINSNSIKTLVERKEHNAIMLNDLVSFLIQLKSIMTYLKKEPKCF